MHWCYIGWISLLSRFWTVTIVSTSTSTAWQLKSRWNSYSWSTGNIMSRSRCRPMNVYLLLIVKCTRTLTASIQLNSKSIRLFNACWLLMERARNAAGSCKDTAIIAGNSSRYLCSEDTISNFMILPRKNGKRNKRITIIMPMKLMMIILLVCFV